MDSSYHLPGFRFHPTEEELLDFYLKKMAAGKNAHCDIIGHLDIYLYDPWVLPGLSKIGEREWYFFVPRDRRHASGGRPNRTTKNGFWKATGSDRKIFGLSDPKKHLGVKKTLVFYKGRAPRGNKTDWVMNEYRLPDTYSFAKEMVLCKIYRKATSMKVLEQRASKMKEEAKTLTPSHPLSSDEAYSFNTRSENNEFHQDLDLFLDEILKQESPLPHVTSVELDLKASKNHDELGHDLFHTMDEDVKEELDVISDATSSNTNDADNNRANRVTSLRLPTNDEQLYSLQVPKMSLDWTQDTFWTQFCSPWMRNVMLSSPYANVVNF
ncbi:hypothetical protein R6Q59_012659 [Mikania micrantha]